MLHDVTAAAEMEKRHMAEKSRSHRVHDETHVRFSFVFVLVFNVGFQGGNILFSCNYTLTNKLIENTCFTSFWFFKEGDSVIETRRVCKEENKTFRVDYGVRPTYFLNLITINSY